MNRSTYSQSDTAIIPWWIGLVEGIAAVILGLFLVISPGMTTLVMVQFLGFFWMIGGILSLVDLFRDTSMWGWKVCAGVLGILAGLIVIRDPLWSAVILVLFLVIMLGIQALIQGIVHFVYAFRGGGIWAVVLGILNVAFGVILLASPALAAVALVLMIGIFAIVGGLFAIIASVRQRNLPAAEPMPGF